MKNVNRFVIRKIFSLQKYSSNFTQFLLHSPCIYLFIYFSLKEGSSALHLAARDGNEDIVESLLDHNTDVTLKSNVNNFHIIIIYILFIVQ